MATAETVDFTPLWNAINERRRDRGWTWAELERRSGVAASLINRFKKKPASETSIRKLAAGFNLDDAGLHELLKLGDRLPQQKRAASLKKVEAAIRSENAFTEQQQDALIAMAHALIDTQNGPNDVAGA